MKFPIAAFLLLMTLSGSAFGKLEVGTVPPDLLGKTPDREEIRISQFKGSVVVVAVGWVVVGFSIPLDVTTRST